MDASMIPSADYVADLQKRTREAIQVHVDAIRELGGDVREVAIMGAWHSIHNGRILKAPYDPSWVKGSGSC